MLVIGLRAPNRCMLHARDDAARIAGAIDVVGLATISPTLPRKPLQQVGVPPIVEIGLLAIREYPRGAGVTRPWPRVIGMERMEAMASAETTSQVVEAAFGDSMSKPLDGLRASTISNVVADARPVLDVPRRPRAVDDPAR